MTKSTWTDQQRAFVAERTAERARQCTCGHTAEQHDHLGYSKRGACGRYKECGCFSFERKTEAA